MSRFSAFLGPSRSARGRIRDPAIDLRARTGCTIRTSGNAERPLGRRSLGPDPPIGAPRPCGGGLPGPRPASRRRRSARDCAGSGLGMPGMWTGGRSLRIGRIGWAPWVRRGFRRSRCRRFRCGRSAWSCTRYPLPQPVCGRSSVPNSPKPADAGSARTPARSPRRTGAGRSCERYRGPGRRVCGEIPDTTRGVFHGLGVVGTPFSDVDSPTASQRKPAWSTDPNGFGAPALHGPAGDAAKPSAAPTLDSGGAALALCCGLVRMGSPTCRNGSESCPSAGSLGSSDAGAHPPSSTARMPDAQ